MSKEPNFQIDAKAMKKNFTLNSTDCPFMQYELRATPSKSLKESGETIWSQFITLNPLTNQIMVNHNNAPKFENNTEFRVYFTAITTGYSVGAKLLIFKFSYLNITLPSFTNTSLPSVVPQSNVTIIPPKDLVNISKPVKPNNTGVIDITDISDIQKLNNGTQKQLSKVEINGKPYDLPKGITPKPIVNDRVKSIADEDSVKSVWAEFKNMNALNFEEYRFDPILPSDPAIEMEPQEASRDGKIGIAFN